MNAVAQMFLQPVNSGVSVLYVSRSGLRTETAEGVVPPVGEETFLLK